MKRRTISEPTYFEIPCFSIPIYNGTLMLCLSPDEWDALAEAYDSETGTDNCKGLATRYYTPTEGRIYVVGVFDRTIDTLIHELAHATFSLLGDVGIPVASGEDNEAFTYVIGWMVRETLPIFLRTSGD